MIFWNIKVWMGATFKPTVFQHPESGSVVTVNVSGEFCRNMFMVWVHWWMRTSVHEMIILPKVICWNSNSQYDGIWRWGLWDITWGHEGDVSKIRVVPLCKEKETWDVSPLCEHSEKVVIQPGKEPLLELDYAGTLISYIVLPAYRTARNKCWLWKPMISCYSNPSWLKHTLYSTSPCLLSRMS